MPVSTIVTTAGSASANSYCSRSVADQYHLDRVPVGTTWLNAQDNDKDAALIWATRLLDSLYEWSGYVVNETQALLWPRSGLLYRSGYTVPTTVIPIELQRATAEFARQLLVTDRTADNDLATQGIRSLTAGPISITFDGSATAATVTAVPDLVRGLLPAEWGLVHGRSGTRDLVRC
jgi:hypothetical protein